MKKSARTTPGPKSPLKLSDPTPTRSNSGITLSETREFAFSIRRYRIEFLKVKLDELYGRRNRLLCARRGAELTRS
jgi:hypothetical protein